VRIWGYTINEIGPQMFTSMNGLTINRDTQLEPKVYLIPSGITIDSDNVTLDGQGATIMGTNKTGQGIRVSGRKNIIIKNLRVMNYYHGVSIKKSKEIEICNCVITSTSEIQSNTLFLDIWKPAVDSYGGAIFLEQVTDTKIHDNDLGHQMNGILSYQCKGLEVINNNAGYCSGFGFHLFETCDSTFTNNYADFCCRYYLSDAGSHLGADAAGFLIVFKSCNNIFRKNYARLGGDGFFLAGLTPMESMLDVTTIYFRKTMHPIVRTTPLKEYLAKAILTRETRQIIPTMASG